ncbi:hypothetical protein KCG44_12860 [Pacificimonas sp. WHA3]|uniref:Uncharacterized protein n=1 Tax=Pacificimonas pallii TaxID=2827236 RepID=A0ABS6SH54_9SPHN|nr:hypothetical protein [Pacificimonas pallii]MBV7257676.1 hypothetical protein [Pacificimonas pallii]
MDNYQTSLMTVGRYKMRVSVSVLISVAILGTTSAATATEPTAVVTEQAEEKKCKRVKLPGSMIKKKYCYTEAEWEYLSTVSKRDYLDAERGLRARNSASN